MHAPRSGPTCAGLTRYTFVGASEPDAAAAGVARNHSRPPMGQTAGRSPHVAANVAHNARHLWMFHFYGQATALSALLPVAPPRWLAGRCAMLFVRVVVFFLSWH